VGRWTATLVCAGWDRKSRMRRRVPLTSGARAGGTGGRSASGDQSCDGGTPTRRGHGRTAVIVVGLAGHLGPPKPSEFAGNRSGDELRVLAAGGEPTVAGG